MPKYEFEYVISKDKKPCCVCNKPTNKVEINYAGRICSVKCCKKMDEDFRRAYNAV